MIKAFRTDPEGLGWYSKIRSFDQYVEKDVIHFVNIGGDPTVLVNNTSYPLEIEELEDDKAVTLDKYQTKPRITDDELYSLSYDKKATGYRTPQGSYFGEEILPSHSRDRPNEKQRQLRDPHERRGVRGSQDYDAQGHRAPQKLFDKNKVPKAGRCLVLCSDHVADLLENDQKFYNQYYNAESGKINKVLGFEIYEYDDCPYYNATTLKKVIRFCSGGYGHAGVSRFLAYAHDESQRQRQDLRIGGEEQPDHAGKPYRFRTYSICLPLKNEAMGAIVSAKVTRQRGRQQVIPKLPDK